MTVQSEDVEPEGNRAQSTPSDANAQVGHEAIIAVMTANSTIRAWLRASGEDVANRGAISAHHVYHTLEAPEDMQQPDYGQYAA